MDIAGQIYKRRFKEEVQFRNVIWKTLCKDFFQKYIPKDSAVIDVGGGYCEFINNIVCKKRIVLDSNEAVKQFAREGVEVIIGNSINMEAVSQESIDTVFVSNFFEHLTREDIVKTLGEIYRILKSGGKLLILQPNIRYCRWDYWMFFDHITPLDDRSMSEILEVLGYTVIERRPKFLPFTTKSRYPKSLALLQLYLKCPLLQNIFGQQAFIVASK